MKTQPKLLILFALLAFLAACKDIMEPSVSNRVVTLEAPGNQYQSPSYTVSFWWDEVEDAVTYRLQVVTPDFTNAAALVLDTVVKSSKFAVNLKPGNYEWRVMAANASSQTAFSPPRAFTVLLGTIVGQSVQLTAPANGFITNQNATTFQWGSLYGATKYHLEIDTNGFANENTLVYNQTIPGQQISFNFPKDQTYQWRVRAENDTTQALWSAINTLTYDHTPPGRVAAVAPANEEQVSLPVALQWSNASTAVKYKVYAFKNDSTTLYNASFPVLVTTNSYTFNLGAAGERVYWRVTAVDAAGNEGLPSLLKSFVLK